MTHALRYRLGAIAPVGQRAVMVVPRRSPVEALQRFGGNRATSQLLSAGVQRKVRVGAPDDRYEREADHVADRVLRMSQPTIQRACAGCAGGAPCAECEEHEDGLTIQRAADSGATAGAVASSVISGLGRGQRLDAGTRAYFEPRFSASFDDVRVHTDANADRASGAVSARAFTLGSSIAFAAGEYSPHTHDGRRLLAHELTHVLQQRSAREPLIQRELVWSSGYPRRFGSDRDEVDCEESPRCDWAPASIDFEATATKSGGGTGQAAFTALLDHIEASAVGSIHELGLIGHANTDIFGLSGRITATDVFFTAPGIISTETLTREAARIAGLRDRFAPGAEIVLYGCNAGAGQALLDAISNAFHVCVKGFTNEIVTCIRWQLNRRRDIFDRGNTWIDDPAALRSYRDIGCENLHTNVRDNIPDRESCVGVPKPKAAPAPSPTPSPRRFGLEPRLGAALSDDGWRAAIGIGVRYSLRSDRAIVWNPIFGAHLIYLPTSGDRVSHIAAAVAEFGVRIQQPLEGFYFDVRTGGYVGIEVPGAGSTESTGAVGGFTPALGLGYHSERFSIGAESRGFVGGGPNQLVILGAGAWHW